MDRADPGLDAEHRELQCARSDTVLSSVKLDAEPRGKIPSDMADLSRSVRTIVLHAPETQ
jgi:hypothetical protein